MTEEFLGLDVTLQLHSGLQITGKVAEIEPSTHHLTLKDATLLFPGQPAAVHTTLYGVIGNEIADLQVKPKKKPAFESLKTNAAPSLSKSCERHRSSKESARSSDNHRQKRTNKDSNAPRSSVSNSTSGSFSRQRRHQASSGWADQDVDGFKGKEFDFQANLNMFDKEKVFAEIRESDESASETLLVTLNRVRRREVNDHRHNLLPTENVLDRQGSESDLEEHQSRIRTVNGGVTCIQVSPLQMAHVEHECMFFAGVTEDQMIENGGRGASRLVLRVIGDLPSKPNPVIIILVGNNKTGATGLCAARHLINHGCDVTVCVSEEWGSLNECVAQQISMVNRIGGKVLYEIEALDGQPEASIVIDAMVGSQQRLIDRADEDAYQNICNMIRWSHRQTAPILSIDFPTGVDGGTGRMANPQYCIRPTWTICLGAPKTGCLSDKITGQLYMADIGIPQACWQRVGVKGWKHPWDADFLVALEYVS